MRVTYIFIYIYILYPCRSAAIPFRAITTSAANASLASLLTDTLALNACFSGTKVFGGASQEAAGEGGDAAPSWTCEVLVPASTHLRRSSRLKKPENKVVAAGRTRCFALTGGQPSWTRMLVERLVPHVRIGTPAQVLCVWDGDEQAQLLRFLLRKTASARVRCTTEDKEAHLTLTPLTERYVRALVVHRVERDRSKHSGFDHGAAGRQR